MPWVWVDDDEDEPTLGVREPLRPRPPTREGGAAVELPRDDYAEADALAESPRLVVVAPSNAAPEWCEVAQAIEWAEAS